MRIIEMITNFFSSNNPEERKRDITNDLMHRESVIGREIFGPVPTNVITREFFCLDERTWVWFEEWTDNGERLQRTTKYTIREDDIVKSVNNSDYVSVSDTEARHLHKAIKLYIQRVSSEIYGINPA